jgi:adenine-specific DNA-methyltransferase
MISTLDSSNTLMDGSSLSISEQRKQELKLLFPGVFTETKNDQGEVIETLDFERLKAELGEFSDVYDNRRERYGMDWPGKRDCLRHIQQTSQATLKPCREESVDFDSTENLFIEGDNLEVLKLLQKSYYGKVKMIYIDPPYNTGKEFIYPDNFADSLGDYLEYAGLKEQGGDNKKWSSSNKANEGRFHTNWLNMMYPRLYLARNLLKEDGVIFISIDENESENLLRVCNEIFGEENYCGTIAWKNSSKNDQAYISIQHEYMHCFVKNKKSEPGLWKLKKEGLDKIYKAMDGFWKTHSGDSDLVHKAALDWYKKFPESSPIYASKHYSWMDVNGVYFPDNISGPNVGQYVYDVIHPVTKTAVKPPSRGWFCPEEKMKSIIIENKVHFGLDETTVPCLKTYLRDTEYSSITSVLFKDGRAASKKLRYLIGEQVFTNPKDEDVLVQLMDAVGVKSNDVVLDFFAGSGTFSSAAYLASIKLGVNINSIAVQLPENLNDVLLRSTGLSKKITTNAIQFLNKKSKPLVISELTKERLRMSCEVLATEYGSVGVDLGFKVLKLDQSNFKQWQAPDKDISDEELIQQMELNVDHVDPNASQEDLLYELLIKAGVMPTVSIEKITLAGHELYSVDEATLLIHLDGDINRDLIDAILEQAPSQFICLDKAFHGDDQLKANAAKTFQVFNRGKDEVDCIDFKTV